MALENTQRPSESIVPACVLIVLNDQAQCLFTRATQHEDWQLPLMTVRGDETAIATAVRLGKQFLALDISAVEPLGFSSAHSVNLIEQADQSPVRLHTSIFSTTHWLAIPGKKAILEGQFFSFNELPAMTDLAQHQIALFQQWLPQRVLQFA